MFKGNAAESTGDITPVMSQMPHKEVYVCTCGARRFKWEATIGTIGVGGFIADEYTYLCLGCGRKHSDKDIKAFFR